MSVIEGEGGLKDMWYILWCQAVIELYHDFSIVVAFASIKQNIKISFKEIGKKMGGVMRGEGRFKDRAERHDLKSRFLLFILLFFFPLFSGGKRKGEKNNQSRDFMPFCSIQFMVSQSVKKMCILTLTLQSKHFLFSVFKLNLKTNNY